MSENSYQNQDIENQNPLRVSMDEVATSATPSSKSALQVQNPKVKLLVILAAITVVLFIVSIFVTLFRSFQSGPKRIATPTPAPAVTPLPTDTTDNDKIPADLKTKFSQVDSNSHTNINFNPPQIDPNIGL